MMNEKKEEMPPLTKGQLKAKKLKEYAYHIRKAEELRKQLIDLRNVYAADNKE